MKIVGNSSTITKEVVVEINTADLDNYTTFSEPKDIKFKRRSTRAISPAGRQSEEDIKWVLFEKDWKFVHPKLFDELEKKYQELLALPLPDNNSGGKLIKKHKCNSCGVNDGTKKHTCPFLSDIKGDDITKCNCCSECENNCCQEC